MRVDEAFDKFQRRIDAKPEHVREGRRRRDAFAKALSTRSEVTAVLPSGSLARGTQLDPIHDVDLIVIFDKAVHPEWDAGPGSAEAALIHTQSLVHRLLGHDNGTIREYVRETRIRNHVVQCFVESKERAESSWYPESFAVETMPALRTADTVLRVPQRLTDTWITADPAHLQRIVHQRQQAWRHTTGLIRMIKYWSRYADLGVKSLAIEVLVLTCMAKPAMRPDELRSEMLARFFTAAATRIMTPIRDPAGHCGVIQPDLPHHRAAKRLRRASDIAARAVYFEYVGEDHKAICCWRAIFGRKFPKPPGGCPGEDGGNGTTGSTRTAIADDSAGEVGTPDVGRPPHGPNPPGENGPPVSGDQKGERPGGPDPRRDRRGPNRPFKPLVPPPLPDWNQRPARPVKDQPQG